jgi:hypothetical protein
MNALVFSRIYSKFYSAFGKYNTRKSLNKLFELYTKNITLRKLSTDQEKSIQEYYKSILGRKVDTKWHQLLYTITGEFTVRYLPFEVYHEILSLLSPWKYKKVLDDKNLYRQLLNEFNLPKRLIECSLGKSLVIENQMVIGGGASYQSSIAKTLAYV